MCQTIDGPPPFLCTAHCSVWIDVVHAYKSLIREKEALEASVKVLSSTSQSKSEKSLSKSASKEDFTKEAEGGENKDGQVG